MESTKPPVADLTRAYAESATWYWDSLGETNRHVIDYLKSLTTLMWHANPIIALAPILRENESRSTEMLASSSQPVQHNVAQPAHRTDAPVAHRRKPAAAKATRRTPASARNGRRSK